MVGRDRNDSGFLSRRQYVGGYAEESEVGEEMAGKAENSYSNHKELTGEMNLLMAQAEMQRLKEVRGTSPRRKWLLRGGALAVAGALFLGASFLKDSFLHLRLLR